MQKYIVFRLAFEDDINCEAEVREVLSGALPLAIGPVFEAPDSVRL